MVFSFEDFFESFSIGAHAGMVFSSEDLFKNFPLRQQISVSCVIDIFFAFPYEFIV